MKMSVGLHLRHYDDLIKGLVLKTEVGGRRKKWVDARSQMYVKCDQMDHFILVEVCGSRPPSHTSDYTPEF